MHVIHSTKILQQCTLNTSIQQITYGIMMRHEFKYANN
jgi:hypothetical protein